MATLKLLALSFIALALGGKQSHAQIQLTPLTTEQPGRAAPKPKPPTPKPQTVAKPEPAKPPPTIAPKGQAKPEDPTAQIDEIVIAPTKRKISNPTAIFTGLDKITGRLVTFEVTINETVQFGALQITPRVCYTRPPTEAPQTTSFVAVTEQAPNGDLRKIFDGWMFAASPGLSGVEHGVYDVWLSNCKQGTASLQQVSAPKR